MNNEKKVLICCPTLGLNPNPQEWLSSLITILNNVRREGFAHATYFPYRQLWWEANNSIWDTAFTHKFDYILRIDDDIWNVPQDAFTKLLAADKDVVGAAYCNQRFPYNVQALVKTEDLDLINGVEEGKRTLKPVQGYGYSGEDVQKVDLVGFGMTLIRVQAFRFCSRPMYKGEEVCPDDSYFAQVCAYEHVEQFVHFGVRINHRHVTMDNAGHLYNADVLAVAAAQQKEKENAKELASAL